MMARMGRDDNAGGEYGQQTCTTVIMGHRGWCRCGMLLLLPLPLLRPVVSVVEQRMVLVSKLLYFTNPDCRALCPPTPVDTLD